MEARRFRAALIAASLILLQYPDWKVALLLAIAIWSFARAYYFAFYVIEHYIDPTFRFAGLTSLVSYLLRRRPPPDQTS